MDNLFWIGFVGAALALIFAYLQKCKVMKCSEGDEKMVKIASSIRAGANAYLKQQYSTVAKVFAVVFVILLIIAFASKGQMLSRVTPFAFLTGGIWSMLAGLIGMKIATAANARTANAAHESLNHGLNVAFSSGTVMGFTVVGLGILDITLWFIGLRYIGKITDPTVLANIMVMNGMGASFMALFARVGGCAIGYFTEYYTSDNYKPTQQLAAASETGSATIIIGGISLGLKSTMASILIVSVAILLSYFCAGGTTTIIDASGAFTAEFNQGLYGIGIAAVGMLSTLGITLATDAYGPVADNAGGIAEMSGLPEEVRDRTDALDSLGNTTAATGKGFAIGSASLTALALLVSYVNIVQTRTPETLNFTLTSPSVLVGLFIGAMLTFVFSALTMSAVQTAAQSIVVEVRRQFREIVGIMDYKADPDYAACVSLCTKGALHEMVAPAILAVVVPIVTGLILGPTGVVGLLGGVSVTGFAMAVFMSNAGGAWDNAKKYIERGNHGGKGSPQHKAAVVGDTVGDPFKDTSGPSLNILIKLCSTVSIVFAGLIIAFNLMNVL